MPDVGDRSIKFPAQTVIQRHVPFDLPAVLGKQIQGRAADVFDLRGTLSIRTGETEQVIRENCIGANGIGRRTVNKVFAIDVEIQRLVEALAAYVSAELE